MKQEKKVDEVYSAVIGLIPERNLFGETEALNTQPRSPRESLSPLTDNGTEGRSRISNISFAENISLGENLRENLLK